MKIALGQRIQDGPWGGGNRFNRALYEALIANGDEVVFGLDHSDIDIILITDPRTRNPLTALTPAGVRSYLACHSQTLVVHRINECDERKGTRTMNARLRIANALADHTVFIGGWLSSLDVWNRDTPMSVILNGADPSVFHDRGQVPWSGQSPFRLVTHHWGAHVNKGFDVYSRLAALQDERFVLTYIGNLPSHVRTGGMKLLPPLDGQELAQELRRHHGYVTASVNEPAGMHHIEGALCGLPLLYRQSGALPEYCRGFGEVFNGPEDVESALERLMAGYGHWKNQLKSYPHTSERMCREYLGLFADLLARRSEVLAARKQRRHAVKRFLARLPL